MKLKEIKQGMAIHCNTQNEYKRLDEEVKNLGLGSLPIRFNENQFDSNYIYIITDFDVVWTDRMSREHIEFSDLIIPEYELSAEEALLAYDQMCGENYYCNDCPIYGIVGDECTHKMDGHIGEIVNAIKQWKAEHEKKKPEIEWFWKSYVIGGSDYKEAGTEQEAMEWCEYYAKEHTESKCTYKHVCRVKAVE